MTSRNSKIMLVGLVIAAALVLAILQYKRNQEIADKGQEKAGVPGQVAPEKANISVAEKKPPQKIEPSVKLLKDLDADHNGLYDDTERKALLEAIKAECPELKITFDADGDGKVTVEEQTGGRHPLSQLIPASLLKSTNKIPWSVNIFPEWIMTAYFQEDVASGNIAEFSPRGTAKTIAAQENKDLQPKKMDSRGGIAFAANSGQFISIPGYRDSRWNYRWCIFTFRINGNSGTGKETVLLDLNKGNGPNKSSPKIWYDKSKGLSVQYVGYNKGGLDKRVMTTKNIATDGKTWNVVVCGIRQGQMFAEVNGQDLTTEKEQPERFSGEVARDTTSYIGDSRKDNMGWAFDALVFGITEPSEAMVRKMSGWAAHRLGFEKNLPDSSPYKNTLPVLDTEDFPHRYVHDNDKWEKWREGINKKETRVNSGGQRMEPKGFERVFYDDFRANRIKFSGSGEGDLWMAPGFNTAVGGAANLIQPGSKPDVYPHDAANKKQILSLGKADKAGKRWRGSAFYSVNDMGQGYTWTGPKVFRTRCMFPKIDPKELPKGLFPAFWSYGMEWLFWRTSNRIENDWFEFDGDNGWWYNGISTHYHYPHVKNIFTMNNKSYNRAKVYGGELKESKTGIPGGIFVWDGQYHTWEFIVDKDMTYVNITAKDKDGKERWYELCRCKTAPTYLERLDLQFDYALKSKHGVLKGDRQDFVVDWVEVLQKTDEIAKVPAPFASRPVLSGAYNVGGTVTCKANLNGIKDVRYYWFADGYPLTYGVRDSYKVTAAEAGKNIRCMVKAAGAKDMPEAWTEAVMIK